MKGKIHKNIISMDSYSLKKERKKERKKENKKKIRKRSQKIWDGSFCQNRMSWSGVMYPKVDKKELTRLRKLSTSKILLMIEPSS